ncbi:MAG: hypothetical protein AB1704_20470 [Pseudomonadota bacterium]
MTTLLMAFMVAPLRFVIGFVLLVFGIGGVAMYKPLPDTSPFDYAIPYLALFKAGVVVGIVILVFVIYRARAEVLRLQQLREAAGPRR